MSLKVVIISDEGAQYIEKGQANMYRNNLEHVAGNPQSGEIVTIETKDHHYLATGFYHETSHVVVRILTRNKEDVINDAFFKNRL